MFDKRDTVPIAILDFGSQFTHMISRRLRDAGIYCEIFSPDVEVSELRARRIEGMILSGGPSSVYENSAPPFNEAILQMSVPILGICYGYQLMAKLLGGRVVPGETKEFGRAELTVTNGSALFKGLQRKETIWMSHGDIVVGLPPGFSQIGRTTHSPYAASENSRTKRYGLQFHCEVAHTTHGKEILANFAVDICGCRPTWNMQSYLESVELHIKNVVGDRSVFLLFSGGIDSTVVFLLLNRVLGPSRVKGLFINTGLLRPGDPEMVNRLRLEHQIENFIYEDATDEFLDALRNVSDPERKRRIIGELFLDVKDRIMSSLDLDPGHWVLAQGTIYPDIITSGGSKHASVIKTHHNALPSLMNIDVLEPLRYLYKDEVRKLAKELGLPDEFIWKHPFPGPGIAVRIAGTITEQKIDLYHKLDEIVLRRLRESGWYEKLWMGFPILIDFQDVSEPGFSFPQDVLSKIKEIVYERLQASEVHYTDLEVSVLPIRSVGVKGDYRTYEHPVEIRITTQDRRCNVSHDLLESISKEIGNKIPLINRVLLTVAWSNTPSYWRKIVVLRMLISVDTLTSDWAKIEYDLLDNMASEIMGVAEDIDAVLLDITQKPPGTMEWE